MVTIRFFIVFLFLARLAAGDGYFRLGGAAGVAPNLGNMSGYTGNGNYTLSNAIATALAATGAKNGIVAFPADAPPGVYVSMIYGAQVSDPPTHNGFIVMLDDNGTAQMSFVIKVDGADWSGPSNGSPEFPISISSGDDRGTQLAQIAGAINSQGFPSSLSGEVIQFDYGAAFTIHPAPQGGPGVNMITVQQGGFGGATRFPAIQTLIDRGWTVTNAK